MLHTPQGRVGWDPFTEMRRMQDEIRRVFAEYEGQAATAGYPPVSLWVGRDSVVVTAELPGVGADDIELSASDDTLTIRGKREPGVDAENIAWHRRERAYGAFSRTVELPFRIDPDRVQARFTNGVIEIELQRPEADKPKRISINAH
ncbi:MAG: Hsp20/alpha crystallin family protein [Hyphomicrobiales bacterium]